MVSDDKLLVLGRISGVFGVKGWVKIFSHTDPREKITDYSPWSVKLEQGWREFEVESGQRHGKSVIAKLKGIDDREAAQQLSGAEIAVQQQQLDELADNEYYWHQLEGLKVVTQQGVELGHISHMLETGANDVMVVVGDRERLIPYTPGLAVIQVDLAEGRVTVDWDPEF